MTKQAKAKILEQINQKTHEIKAVMKFYEDHEPMGNYFLHAVIDVNGKHYKVCAGSGTTARFKELCEETAKIPNVVRVHVNLD